MRYAKLWLLSAAVAYAGAAIAGENRSPDVSTADTAAETRAWLELQRSGRSAAAPRSTSGPVATRVYKRYLDSFDHPLPAFFERDAGVSAQR